MSIHLTIGNTLNADAQLAALLASTANQVGGKSVVFGAMPAGGTTPMMPYIVWMADGGPPPQFSAPIQVGAPYAEFLRVTFKIVATDGDAIKKIAHRLDAILLTQAMAIDDATSLGWIRLTPLDDIDMLDDVEETDVDVYEFDVDYEAWLGRTVGA